MPTPQHDPSSALTASQARTIAALLPADVDAIRQAVAGESGYRLYTRNGTGLALVLVCVEGKLAGWIAFPASSHESAKRLGLQLVAGLDDEARAFLGEASEAAQNALQRAASR